VDAAAFYQSAAAQGLQRRDAEQTGYTLKAAAECLSAAHAFGERQPQVSRALFDADQQVIRDLGQAIQQSSAAGCGQQQDTPRQRESR
jgi:hypothetical protein